jgi:hypothetical protein
MLKLDMSIIETQHQIENALKSRVRHIQNLGRRFKVALLHKGSSLIYFGMSKLPHESTHFLRRQLEVLHL